MAKEEKMQERKRWHQKMNNNHASGGAIYGLGLLGAAIYYLQHATTFGAVVVGILKAIVWPIPLRFTRGFFSASFTAKAAQLM
jgi:hypothetical protein